MSETAFFVVAAALGRFRPVDAEYAWRVRASTPRLMGRRIEEIAR